MPEKSKSVGKTGQRSKPVQAEGSALALLQQDHREVEAYFDEYETLKSDREKEALALKICLALQIHAQIEEEIFYPAARDALEDAELIDKAIVEHSAARQLINEIEALEAGDQLREAKVKVLGEQVRHHVEEEENELFPQLQGEKLDLETLGREIATLKQELLTELAEGKDPL